MTFYEMLEQVIALLQRHGQLSYRALTVQLNIVTASKRRQIPSIGNMGIRLRWDSWNMTAVTQKCMACPSLVATALEA
jgi:hypothetical protein